MITMMIMTVMRTKVMMMKMTKELPEKWNYNISLIRNIFLFLT